MKTKLRNQVLDVISNEINRQSIPLYIYGSFSNNTFHLDTLNWESFSDIDIVAYESCNYDNVKDNLIAAIYQKLNLRFEISIRNRKIHNRDLDWFESYLIAQLEFFYKIQLSKNEEYLVYQLSKFILRVIGFPYYFDNPLLLNLYLKNGIKSPLAQILIHNKLHFTKGSYSYNALIKEIIERKDDFAYCIEDFLRRLEHPYEIGNMASIYSLIKRKMFNRHELIKDAKRKVEKAIGYCN